MEEKFNIREFLTPYMKKWRWFTLSILVSIFIFFIYLRYTSNIYGIEARVLIKNNEFSDFNSGEKIVEELGYFTNRKNLRTELEVIKSYSIINESLSKIPFYVSYEVKGDVKTTENYITESPYIINIDTSHTQLFNAYFEVKKVNEESYRILIEPASYQVGFVNSDELSRLEIDAFDKLVHSGDTVEVQGMFKFQFYKTNKDFKEGKYSFRINNLDQLTLAYLSNIKVKQPDEYASIINMSLECKNLAKGIVFLNQLASDYVERDLKEMNVMAQNTLNFINSQIDSVERKLNSSANKLQEFRVANKMIDFDISSSAVFQKFEELQKEKAKLLVAHKYFLYLKNFIISESSKEGMVAPSIVEIKDGLLLSMLNELEKLYSRKKELGISANEKSPVLIMLDEQIESLEGNVVQNLDNLLKNSNIKIDDINERLETTSHEISKLPKTERDLVIIERDFQLNQEIYNYLLEKKSSIGIAKAGYIKFNQLIDRASVTRSKLVSPNKKLIFTFMILIGLIVPVVLIYVIKIFNTKIDSVVKFKSNLSIPLLGVVPHFQKSNGELLNNGDHKDIIYESFRELRLKTQEILKVDNKKVLAITSTISGEGKTFCALNLASSFALSGKKVIIIGGDLRRPKLNVNLNLDGELGLTEFLVGEVGLDEVIQSSEVDKLSVITSGEIPPNPGELLELDKFSDLIKELKNSFDLIIIDTPPVGLVPDVYVISKHADINLFLFRHKYSSEKSKDFLISQKDNLKNIYCIYNDARQASLGYDYGFGYGYGYGYGYGTEKKKNIFGKDVFKNIMKIFDRK